MRPIVSTTIGALIEVFGADLFVVGGLAMQKVAVMKIIETNRLRSAGDPADASDDEDDMSESDSSETNSEVMTMITERSLREANELNDTQVPDMFDLMRSCGWLLGLLIFILGNVLELLALSFASQTDISLLTNFALIWNAIFSVLIFKEDFNVRPPKFECSVRVFKRWDLFHCVILLIGSMMAVLFTPQEPEDDFDSKELLRLWATPPYVFWGGFMLIAMFCTSLFLVKNWRNHKTGNLNAALIAGLCGFMSAFCVTLSKVATTLISSSARGHNVFSNPEAVFMVTLWAVMLVSQLFLLNVALGSFEQGVVIPIYEVVGTIASITSGILFYHTYDDFDTIDWIGFGVGVFLMSWGVWLVAHREVHTQQELSNNLYSNLSAVDDMLRLPPFTRSISESSRIPLLSSNASRSAALDMFDSHHGDTLDDAMRQLYTVGEQTHADLEQNSAVEEIGADASSLQSPVDLSRLEGLGSASLSGDEDASLKRSRSSRT